MSTIPDQLQSSGETRYIASLTELSIFSAIFSPSVTSIPKLPCRCNDIVAQVHAVVFHICAEWVLPLILDQRREDPLPSDPA